MEYSNDEYSLLVVDDEELIRNAVTTIIDWRSLGFSAIYEAEDGEDALKICRSEKIDLVLTDIVMPFMDGMELSRIIKEEFPEIHIVILTGHEEFEYAKQSINYGVKNYILKPIGAESLYREMETICSSLNIESRQKRYVAKMRSQLHESLPLLREKFLYSLVCTSYHMGKDNEQRIQALEIPLYSKKYMVGIIEADVSSVEEKDMELFLFAIKNICLDTVGNQHCVFEDNNRTAVVFNLDRYGEAYHNIVYDTMEVILKAIEIALKIQSAGAIGAEADKIGGLHQSYCQANTALECRYFLGYDRIYDIHDLDYMGNVFLYPTDEIKQFIYSMKFQGSQEMADAMKMIELLCLGNQNLSIYNIKMIFFELLNAIIKELSAVKMAQELLWQQGISLYKTMDSLQTVRQLSAGILNFANQVAEALHLVQSNSSLELIHAAKKYLDQHYMQADLSLHMAAEHVGISTGYLSGLFKKETGTNFIEYLTNVRMEHAMELMQRTDKKNYEIAEETGFSNPHYFSISFKKYSGMSPSEFRSRKDHKR